MKCQICQKADAALEITQVVAGEQKKLHVCEECASNKPIDATGQLTLSDFLVSLNAAEAKAADVSETSCPECHMRKSDFRQSTLLGCPACYEAFAEDLLPMMRQMHRGVEHVGKVPARQRASAMVSELEQRLEQAVARQDYERAAQLRDELSSVRSTMDPSSSVIRNEA